MALTMPQGHEPRYGDFRIDGLMDETLREGSERCLFAVDVENRYRLVEKIVDAGVRQLMIGSGPEDPDLLARCLQAKLEERFPAEVQFVFVILLNSWEPLYERFKRFPKEYLADAVVSFGMVEIGQEEQLMERVFEKFAGIGVKNFRASLLNNFSAGLDEAKYGAICGQIDRCIALGMDTVRVNDSLGLLYPETMAVLAANLRRDYPELNFALHAHDDRGLGLQNALVSVYNGFNMIEGSVAGFGNRSGLPLIETIELIFREKGIEIADASLVPERLVEAAVLAEEVFMTVPDIYRPVSGMLVEKENFGTLNIPDYLGVEREATYFLNEVELHENTVRKSLSVSDLDEKYVNDPGFIETVREEVKERLEQVYELKRSEYPVLLEHVRRFYGTGVLTATDIQETAQRCAARYARTRYARA